MHVSLPALKAFEAAARLGSFKAAARELAISPTAVSHHINKLEQRLSVTLFERAARKVTLTEPAKELALATSQGFAIINSAIDNITRKNEQINVVTTSSFAALVLIPALHTFYRQFPEHEVHVTSGENIDANTYTLAIRLGNIAQQAHTDVLKQERFNLFCTPGFASQFDSAQSLVIYSTKWKNSALPCVPLPAWIDQNNMTDKKLEVREFDQELFGLQQALLENACVFCSTTLAQGYVQSGLLCELPTASVASELCYYLADKDQRSTRHNSMFIAWLSELLSTP